MLESITLIFQPSISTIDNTPNINKTNSNSINSPISTSSLSSTKTKFNSTFLNDILEQLNNKLQSNKGLLKTSILKQLNNKLQSNKGLLKTSILEQLNNKLQSNKGLLKTSILKQLNNKLQSNKGLLKTSILKQLNNKLQSNNQIKSDSNQNNQLIKSLMDWGIVTIKNSNLKKKVTVSVPDKQQGVYFDNDDDKSKYFSFPKNN